MSRERRADWARGVSQSPAPAKRRKVAEQPTPPPLPRVTLGIPIGGPCPAQSVDALLRLAHRNAGLVTHVETVVGQPIEYARNELAFRAIAKNDSTHLLMCDSDMTPTVDVLECLLAHRKPIVAALALHRGGGWEVWDARTDEEIRSDNLPASGLLEVSKVGFGCVLIETDVFRRLSRPWFDGVAREGRNEDLKFCERVRSELGLSVFVDCDVPVGHVVSVVLSRDTLPRLRYLEMQR